MLGLRPPIEGIPPAEYLRMSYNEKFIVSITERLVASDLVTRAEIDSGKPAEGTAKENLALSPADAVATLMKWGKQAAPPQDCVHLDLFDDYLEPV